MFSSAIESLKVVQNLEEWIQPKNRGYGERCGDRDDEFREGKEEYIGFDGGCLGEMKLGSGSSVIISCKRTRAQRRE